MSKKKIVYFMDIMCGWCYAFSNVSAGIMEKYRDEFDFEIIPGGMFEKDKVYLSEKMEQNILGSFEMIKHDTGADIGEGYRKFIKNYGKNLESITGSLAINAFCRIKPESSYEYAHRLQVELFENGKDVTDVNVCMETAKEFGVSEDEFMKVYSSDENRRITEEGFRRVYDWQVELYPSLYILDEETGEYRFIVNTKGTVESVSALIDSMK